MRAGAAIIGGTGGHVPLNILVDPDPLTRGSAPGPRWGLRPQTPVPPPFRRNRRHCMRDRLRNVSDENVFALQTQHRLAARL